MSSHHVKKAATLGNEMKFRTQKQICEKPISLSQKSQINKFFPPLAPLLVLYESPEAIISVTS